MGEQAEMVMTNQYSSSLNQKQSTYQPQQFLYYNKCHLDPHKQLSILPAYSSIHILIPCSVHLAPYVQNK